LMQEPTVLAPAPDLPQAGLLHRWAIPLGLAAGLALVLGTLLVLRQDPLADAPALVADARPAPSLQRVELAAAASSPSAPVLLRDPRLDRYLAAHKQFQSANAMGPSTGFIRSATYDAATR
jgi:sigma-E factor negative regulatory protein RseA